MPPHGQGKKRKHAPLPEPSELQAGVYQYTEIFGQNPAKHGLTGYSRSRLPTPGSSKSASSWPAAPKPTATFSLPCGTWTHTAETICDIPADGREDESRRVTNSRTILVPEAEYKVPWQERHTFPKSDKYKVLETVLA